MLPFAKAHAYGNDFLYVDQSLVGDVPRAALARQICDRHTGIGADGLILYQPTPGGATMTLSNADGSRAEVSGNGLRGLAALLLRHDERDRTEVMIGTEAGEKRVTRISRDGPRQTFRSGMGAPRDIRHVSLMAAGETLSAVLLDMGNPQCVLLGRLPDEDRFRRVGAALEHHSMFAAGTNVEFAEIEAPDRVRIMIWERGCGPTQSSGTGSCAAAVAAASHGGAARDVEIVAPGGAQRVEWLADGVYLTGWAELICEGGWFGPMPGGDFVIRSS
jgi:diaminopimelate epimerase